MELAVVVLLFRSSPRTMPHVSGSHHGASGGRSRGFRRCRLAGRKQPLDHLAFQAERLLLGIHLLHQAGLRIERGHGAIRRHLHREDRHEGVVESGPEVSATFCTTVTGR